MELLFDKTVDEEEEVVVEEEEELDVDCIGEDGIDEDLDCIDDEEEEDDGIDADWIGEENGIGKDEKDVDGVDFFSI